jgi:hypothetical protein
LDIIKAIEIKYRLAATDLGFTYILKKVTIYDMPAGCYGFLGKAKAAYFISITAAATTTPTQSSRGIFIRGILLYKIYFISILSRNCSFITNRR